MLRGVPVDRYDADQAGRALWCLGQYAGMPFPQDAARNLLHHVRDTGGNLQADPNLRGFQTNNELYFHTDGGDLFMLLCRRQAKSGGRCRLLATAPTRQQKEASYVSGLAPPASRQLATRRCSLVGAGAGSENGSCTILSRYSHPLMCELCMTLPKLSSIDATTTRESMARKTSIGAKKYSQKGSKASRIREHSDSSMACVSWDSNGCCRPSLGPGNKSQTRDP